MGTGREKFKSYAPVLMILVKFFSLFPINVLKRFFSVFQNIKGVKGIAIRYILIKSICTNCGDNVSIHPNVYLFHVEKIRFGSNVSIHPMCYIDAEGEISIGDNVSIAHATTILSSNHQYKNVNTPIKYQGMEFKKTIIRDNVWIGAKTTILSGVEIKEGSVIAAGAVVTKNVDKNSIVAGVPAKEIKKRNLRHDEV